MLTNYLYSQPSVNQNSIIQTDFPTTERFPCLLIKIPICYVLRWFQIKSALIMRSKPKVHFLWGITPWYGKLLHQFTVKVHSSALYRKYWEICYPKIYPMCQKFRITGGWLWSHNSICYRTSVIHHSPGTFIECLSILMHVNTRLFVVKSIYYW